MHQVADAVVRVFIEHGDRTDRTKARLKYVLERMGLESSLRWSRRSSAEARRACPPKRWRRGRPSTGTAHIGVHPQKQPG